MYTKNDFMVTRKIRDETVEVKEKRHERKRRGREINQSRWRRRVGKGLKTGKEEEKEEVTWECELQRQRDDRGATRTTTCISVTVSSSFSFSVRTGPSSFPRLTVYLFSFIRFLKLFICTVVVLQTQQWETTVLCVYSGSELLRFLKLVQKFTAM